MDITQFIADHKFLNKTHCDYLDALKMKFDNLKFADSHSISEKVNKLIKYKDDSSYLQGAGELILWFFFERNKLKYSPDYITSGGLNCDLSVVVKGIQINIEVKSPKINQNDKVCSLLNTEDSIDIVQVSIPFRSAVSKEKCEAELEEIQAKLKDEFREHGKNPLFLTGAPIDNPLFQSIAKAVTQLPQANGKNLNLIFVRTTTQQMGKYLDYLKNSETGILTRNFTSVRGNGNHPWELTRKRMSNVAGVIVSNIMDKHLQFSPDGWEIENSTSLLVWNDNGSEQFFKDIVISVSNNLFAFLFNERANYLSAYLDSIKNELMREGLTPEKITSTLLSRIENEAHTSTFFYKYLNDKATLER